MIGPNRVYTILGLSLLAEGALCYEQRQPRSGGKRVSAVLRMARAELLLYMVTSPLQMRREAAIVFIWLSTRKNSNYSAMYLGFTQLTLFAAAIAAKSSIWAVL